MLHVRIATSADHAPPVVALLRADPAVCDVLHLRGAPGPAPSATSTVEPDVTTDLILCDVARGRASSLMEEVSRLDPDAPLSVSILEIAAMVSPAAQAAVAAAGGRPSDAVVWEEVEESTASRAGLSRTFLVFMAIAVLIAAVGVLTDSQVLIVGAMIVGPDFGPLAGLCVALAERRRALVLRSLAALVVGFGSAMVLATGLTLVVRALGAGPVSLGVASLPFTRFVSHPDGFSVLVAVLAGAGGLLTVTQARSGALIGILVSVTTVPAAAGVAVGLAYGDPASTQGAAWQLALNVVAFVAAGTATYAVQRAAFRRGRSVPAARPGPVRRTAVP